MSDSKNKWSTYAVVIGACVAIGFGAVYAMVGGGDNRATPNVAQLVKPQPPGLHNENAPPATSVGAEASNGAGAAGLSGAALNRGAMTTFVFKKQRMPITSSPAFNGPDGKPMMLANFKGKIVLLNLWATWCAPCREEMPYLDQLQRELGSDQFEVVALSIDRGGPDKAKKFLAEVGATSLKFYHDPEAKAGFALMAIGMPTTLLIDREGREVGRLVGPAEWHSADAKNLIKAAIAAD